MTWVDLSGARYPANFNGKPIYPMEGTSLRPLMTGAEVPPRTLYWEHEGNGAIRVGDRKLVRQGLKGTWELFDMVADRTEQHDLAAMHPEEVASLQTNWRAWAKRANVIPRSKKK